MGITATEAQMFGKLSAIEFVLEVLLANELAAQDAADTEAFKRALVQRTGHLTRGPVDADDLLAIQAEMHASLSNFVAKVAAREAELRAQLAV